MTSSGSGQASPSHVLEELAAARRVLLAPWRQVEKHLMAVRQHAPGGQHRLARLPQMQPLGDSVDKQDRSRLANASYSAHSRSVTSLTAVRESKERPSSSANSASMSRVDSPRAYISTASASNSSVRPRMISRSLE